MLFGTNRYQASWAKAIIYEFQVNDGTFDVRLYFAEKPFNSVDAGDRKFGIEIEEIEVATNLDITAEVGNGTLQKNYQVMVSDGKLKIELIRGVGDPLISGVEIFGAVPPVPKEKEEGFAKELSIYPNPSTGKFTLEFEAQEVQGNNQLKIYDRTGRLISDQSYELKAGQYRLDIEGQQLSPGLYFIHLIGGAETQMGKLMIE